LEIVRRRFATEKDAYIFYNKYAREKGFSVRKQKVRRAKRSGELLFRRFLCSKEGQRLPKWLNKKPCKRRPRALTRCGCLARLEVKLDRSQGLWYVHRFIDRHNHRLATQDEAPFLWSHRKLKDFQRTEIMSMETAGIRKNVIMEVLKCRYGGYTEVGIIRKDAYNLSSRYKRSRIANGDAMTVLGLMESRQKADPEFFL
jgi:zinc finger SWIM domain-containing protein 3